MIPHTDQAAHANMVPKKTSNAVRKKPVKQKGPFGPYVAHLRKTSKVTVEPFTEDH